MDECGDLIPLPVSNPIPSKGNRKVHFCPVRRCNCNNFDFRDDINVSFFSFPHDETRRNKWLSRIQRLDLMSIPKEKFLHKYRLCGLHFPSDAFVNPFKRNRLKADAVPEIENIAIQDHDYAKYNCIPIVDDEEEMETEKEPGKEKSVIIGTPHISSSTTTTPTSTTTSSSKPLLLSDSIGHYLKNVPTVDVTDIASSGKIDLKAYGQQEPPEKQSKAKIKLHGQLAVEQSQEHTASEPLSQANKKRRFHYPLGFDKNAVQKASRGEVDQLKQEFDKQRRQHRKEIEKLKGALSRRNDKMKDLEELVKELNPQRTIAEDIKHILNLSTEHVGDKTLSVFSMQLRNSLSNKNKKWTKEDMSFASGLFQISPEAYRYINTYLSLPSSASIRKYNSSSKDDTVGNTVDSTQADEGMSNGVESNVNEYIDDNSNSNHERSQNALEHMSGETVSNISQSQTSIQSEDASNNLPTNNDQDSYQNEIVMNPDDFTLIEEANNLLNQLDKF